MQYSRRRWDESIKENGVCSYSLQNGTASIKRKFKTQCIGGSKQGYNEVRKFTVICLKIFIIPGTAILDLGSCDLGYLGFW